jgi:RNA polymerase sigma factor (sigma-70 family)
MTGKAGRRGSRRWDADQALTALYDRHYRGLTQLAVLLVDDVTAAEEVAQSAFAVLHGAGRQPLGGDRALSILRREVISRARSHRADRPRQPQAVRQAQVGGDALLLALRALPGLQREALVLRYYTDLTDAQIASAMGIGARAVHVHISRGMAALQAALDGKITNPLSERRWSPARAPGGAESCRTRARSDLPDSAVRSARQVSHIEAPIVYMGARGSARARLSFLRRPRRAHRSEPWMA